MSDLKVAGVVLAAGESTRMGRPKLLLPFGPATLLGHCVGQAEQSRLDSVTVVVGRLGAEMRRTVHLRRAGWAVSPHPELGTAETVRVGVAAAGPAAAYVILAGDTPGVDAGLISDVTEYARSNLVATRTVYSGGGWGHPYVLPAALVADLGRYQGDKALAGLLTNAYDASGRARPRDINRWEDYLAACAEFGYEPSSSDPTA